MGHLWVGGDDDASAARRATIETADLLVAAEPYLREVEMLVARAHDPGFEHAVEELAKLVRAARKSATAAMPRA